MAFRVDQYNGTISTFCGDCQAELDREKVEVYFITYTATDLGGRSNSTSLVVHLTDRNDNTPVFARPTYSTFIRENDPSYNSTALVKLEAFDADEPWTNNSEIRYEIMQVSPESMELNITINHKSGEMFLSPAIDYEKLKHAAGIIRVTVEARDLGSPSRASNASLQITVQDVNDKTPVFNSSTFCAKITENSTSIATALTPVGRVFASDADGTDPNNKSQFFITDGANNDFTVNSLTGEVSVQINRELDRETTPSYNVTIIAIDQGAPPLTGTATLSIDIIDINDEFPVFSRTSYTVQVFENEHIGKIVIDCPATDADENNKLEYTIIKTEAKDELGHNVNYTLVENYFSIHENNGSVYVSNPPDRETAKTVELTVQVTDTNAYHPYPQTAEAQLTIMLLDVNDNHPDFVGLPYNINVSENAQDNTILLTIQATDKDENRIISYSINRSSTESISFDIDQVTGVLTKIGPLDRETTSPVTLHITATDNGVPPLSSSTEVFVTVLDVNDNAPQLFNFKDEISIPENLSINALVLQVTAIDTDIGPNAHVTYQIEDEDDGKFKIDPITGRIEVSAELDRETKPTYTLRIKAQDNPLNPKEQKSTSDVLTVKLIDTNDNSPYFMGSLYSKRILENTEIGTLVVKVSAEDADEPGTNNSLISYSISYNTSPPGLFEINQFSGDIILNKSLIGDVRSYLIGLVVEDHGDPKLQTNSVVNITVLDVNLNAPVITNVPSNNIIKVYECVDVGYEIFHFNYFDADMGINAQADFNISEIDCGISDSIFDVFEIEPVGTLKVIGKLTKDSYRFQIQVTDRGVPPLSSDKITVIVRVVDVNDHLPSFSEDNITFRVKENQPAGEVVGSVQAHDPDQDSVTCYNIEDDNVAKVFAIDLNNGRIFTKVNLNYENATKFMFTVHVIDCSIAVNITECGNITASNQADYRDTINVTINVIDVKDIAPVSSTQGMCVGYNSWNFTSPCNKTSILEGNFKFPHPTSRNKLLICDLSCNTYVAFCPPNEVFHDKCLVCAHPNQTFSASCSKRAFDTINPCSNQSISAGKRFFPHPNDDKMYIHCDTKGTPWVQDCPPGSVWEQTKLACTLPLAYNPCHQRRVTSQSLFPHYCDPRSYIHCNEYDQPFIHICQKNYLFLPWDLTCAPPGFPGSEYLRFKCH
ncbi:protocadherin Fat 4-like [Mercenaria mercenaria]|uniref:protocadherin Fat 4-like n=1 Tax=Mercenaria mercenaria TaxID=6596 RepID=UPI00234F7889|nr:protocadherin Fat 4-like [Mercenaria mercenaria]